MAESGSIAVLAEKPSVARDIACVLGASQQGKGYLHGNGYVVTWAIGHLAALPQPHEINPDWHHWRRNLLPMLPAERCPSFLFHQSHFDWTMVGDPDTGPQT
jgi:DNA topoisomerase-3